MSQEQTATTAAVPAQKWRLVVQRLGIEWFSAIVSSAAVSPFISIIDKSIIANAAGKQPLMEGIKSGLTLMVTRPVQFVQQPAFKLIWVVYAGTYYVQLCFCCMYIDR